MSDDKVFYDLLYTCTHVPTHAPVYIRKFVFIVNCLFLFCLLKNEDDEGDYVMESFLNVCRETRSRTDDE